MPWLWTDIEAQRNNRSNIPWKRRAVIECDRCKAIRRRYVWNKPLSELGVFCSRKCSALGRWDATLGAASLRDPRACKRCGVVKEAADFYGSSKGDRLRSWCKDCCDRAGYANTKAVQRERQMHGLCVRCGLAQAAARRALCKPCLATRNEKELARQAQRIAAGRCTTCNEVNTIAGKVCVTCWFKRAANDTIDDQSRWPDLQALWARQDGRCALTGVLLVPGAFRVALDHITPQARGGTHEIENLRWVTNAANKAKNALSDPEFLELCRRVVATLGKKQLRRTQGCPSTPSLFATEGRPAS